MASKSASGVCRTALALTLLLLPAASHSQSPSPPDDAPRRSENPFTKPDEKAEPPKPAGQLTRAPVLLQFVEAPYPPEAKAAHLSGSVGLVVDLDEQGHVARVEISESAGHGFDEAATEAVKGFRFSPACRRGWASSTATTSLSPKRSWHRLRRRPRSTCAAASCSAATAPR